MAILGDKYDENAVKINDHSRYVVVYLYLGGELNKLNQETKLFTRYLHDPENSNSLGNNIIEAICEDSSGVLWIGTNGGLDRFDRILELLGGEKGNDD